MALVESHMMALGTSAPAFSLKDVVSGKMINSNSMGSVNGTVIMFICNHCPYVIHVRDQLVKLANDYQSKGIQFIAINSNDVNNYPDDSPDNMIKIAKEFNYPFPYCFDESQSVAKAYDAACTPDFFVFDGQSACVYRGRLDGSTPGNDVPLTGEDLRHTLDALLSGNPINDEQIPSMGCSIKWK